MVCACGTLAIMYKVRNRTLFVVVAIALYVSAASPGQTLENQSYLVGTNVQTERITIAVGGMRCDSCAAGIRAMLKRTSGVVSAAVSYQRKEVIVEYDPAKITPERVVEAINNLGYKAKVKT